MLFKNLDVDGLNIFYREAGSETECVQRGPWTGHHGLDKQFIGANEQAHLPLPR
jgi:hypothetical protein